MLAITAIGMISSVGHNSETSCASIRAGISRRESLEFFSTLGEDSGEEEPVFACPVAIITVGFVLVGRWVQLAVPCLEDCAKDLESGRKMNDEFWQRTGLIVVLPELMHERFLSDEECGEQEVAAAVLPPILDLFSRPVELNNTRMMCRGHAGTAFACREAAEWIDGCTVDRVIVLGVDSYLDPHSVDWLDSQNRLCTESNPAGVLPGEAAAAVVLEKIGSFSTTKRRVPVILGASTGSEAKNFSVGELSYGEGLTIVANDLVSSIGENSFKIQQVISDVNGETWRSHELGCVRMKMREQFAENVGMIFPAESVGDVGAASGALAVNMCVQAFGRHYGKSDSMFIFSSSDNGDVGVMNIAIQ